MDNKIDLSKIKQEKTIEELLDFCIFNIDKPSGPTSFYVDVFIKRLLNTGKTSHFGTLDPRVTGVLPIAVSKACRLLGYFIKKEKTYVGIMRINEDKEIEEIKKIIEKKFLGKIKQLPPVKSRVKREEREREIYDFKILEKNNKDFLFEVRCEAGTYVRKLVHDLGLEIGGAHMLELRRTKAGIFSEEDDNFVNLYEFEKAFEEYKNGNEEGLRKIIIPGEIISKILPVIFVKENSLPVLYNGSPIFEKYLENKDRKKFATNDKVAVFCKIKDKTKEKIKFIEVARVTKEGNIFARPEFVMH